MFAVDLGLVLSVAKYKRSGKKTNTKRWIIFFLFFSITKIEGQYNVNHLNKKNQGFINDWAMLLFGNSTSGQHIYFIWYIDKGITIININLENRDTLISWSNHLQLLPEVFPADNLPNASKPSHILSMIYSKHLFWICVKMSQIPQYISWNNNHFLTLASHGCM